MTRGCRKSEASADASRPRRVVRLRMFTVGKPKGSAHLQRRHGRLLVPYAWRALPLLRAPPT